MTREHISALTLMTSYHAQLSKGRKNVIAIQKTGSFQNQQSMFQLLIKYSSGYDNEKTNKQTNYTATSNNNQKSLIDNIAFAKVSCLCNISLFFFNSLVSLCHSANIFRLTIYKI